MGWPRTRSEKMRAEVNFPHARGKHQPTACQCRSRLRGDFSFKSVGWLAWRADASWSSSSLESAMRALLLPLFRVWVPAVGAPAAPSLPSRSWPATDFEAAPLLPSRPLGGASPEAAHVSSPWPVGVRLLLPVLPAALFVLVQVSCVLPGLLRVWVAILCARW